MFMYSLSYARIICLHISLIPVGYYASLAIVQSETVERYSVVMAAVWEVDQERSEVVLVVSVVVVV